MSLKEISDICADIRSTIETNASGFEAKARTARILNSKVEFEPSDLRFMAAWVRTLGQMMDLMRIAADHERERADQLQAGLAQAISQREQAVETTDDLLAMMEEIGDMSVPQIVQLRQKIRDRRA